MSDFVAIANDAISQIKELKRNRLRFNSPIYLAIYNDDHIEKSNLWFILKNADMAVVILPFEYRVITSESSSAYILFIDKNGTSGYFRCLIFFLSEKFTKSEYEEKRIGNTSQLSSKHFDFSIE